ncbi:MAG TPA: cysteine synthase A, partial [Bacillota bacterium]|nr:cysteine synthase A [Bacillota bacterium]
MEVFADVTQLIGSTPIVRLNRLPGKKDAEVLVKLESFNPGGSIKDRIALNMVLAAEKQNIINKDTVIVEPTSGNTGIGLAMVAAARGYKLLLVMPDTMSEERRKLMRAYGAEFLLTPGEHGMKGAVDKALELVEQNPNYFMPQQFKNPANPEAHSRFTASEILAQLGTKVDAFVAGVGTGGTITGVGRVLKEAVPGIQVVAVEPDGSPVLSEGRAGTHGIQGIGAGFVPDVLDRGIVDRIIRVTDHDARETARGMAS